MYLQWFAMCTSPSTAPHSPGGDPHDLAGGAIEAQAQDDEEGSRAAGGEAIEPATWPRSGEAFDLGPQTVQDR